MQKFDKKTCICPHCWFGLKDYYTLIPSRENKNKKIKVEGEYCGCCNILYITKDREKYVFSLLADNKNAMGFILNKESLYDFTKRKKREDEKTMAEKRMENIKSAKSAICVTENNIRKCYIAVDDRKDENIQENVLHYTNRHILDLLTIHRIQPNNKQRIAVYESSSEQFTVRAVYIKHDGGFYSSTINTNCELVDLLCFLETTGKYEIIKATYDKDENICYIDNLNYRLFKHIHGKPSNLIIIGENFDEDLSTESILKKHGYTVDKRSAVTSAKRQEILAYIVDNKILTVARIIDYLSWFIHKHSGVKYADAVRKWSEDIEFIKNYKVHTKTFFMVTDEILKMPKNMQK